MKKMNFVFIHRILDGVSKRGLMILFMLFLIGFGFNTASAQYVSKDVAISRLTQEIVSNMENMDNLAKSGNWVAVEKSEVKLSVYREMIQKLRNGSSVAETVDYFIGNPNATSSMADFQLYNPRSSQDNGWLIVEIKQLLEL